MLKQMTNSGSAHQGRFVRAGNHESACGFLATTSFLSKQHTSRQFVSLSALTCRRGRFRLQPSRQRRPLVITCQEAGPQDIESVKQDNDNGVEPDSVSVDNAYSNFDLSASEEINVEDEDPEELGKRMRAALRQITESENALCHPNPDGLKMSHSVIQFDEDGNGPRDRYVYVEERDCIGCTHCATTASSTFFLEDLHGRARVYDQEGDIIPVVEEAIDTCPVNCIYYVSWEDLVALELERRSQQINNWARLVGGQDISSSKKAKRRTTVMDSAIIRCEDCPGRGCKTCPMFGVGENPEYLRRTKQRTARNLAKQKEVKRTRRQL